MQSWPFSLFSSPTSISLCTNLRVLHLSTVSSFWSFLSSSSLSHLSISPSYFPLFSSHSSQLLPPSVEL
jgi:hypothetical protein